ncbi:MAG: hypothetical protein ACK4IC_11230 [Erythrobacter sp.]
MHSFIPALTRMLAGLLALPCAIRPAAQGGHAPPREREGYRLTVSLGYAF